MKIKDKVSKRIYNWYTWDGIRPMAEYEDLKINCNTDHYILVEAYHLETDKVIIDHMSPIDYCELIVKDNQIQLLKGNKDYLDTISIKK